jgi:hypothetical protein
MPSGTRKAKCTFRRIVAPEPISVSELDTAERLLARFVALAYVSDHRGLFTSGTEELLTDRLSLFCGNIGGGNGLSDRSCTT